MLLHCSKALYLQKGASQEQEMSSKKFHGWVSIVHTRGVHGAAGGGGGKTNSPLIGIILTMTT